jgi:hypothetical protein
VIYNQKYAFEFCSFLGSAVAIVVYTPWDTPGLLKSSVVSLRVAIVAGLKYSSSTVEQNFVRAFADGIVFSPA